MKIKIYQLLAIITLLLSMKTTLANSKESFFLSAQSISKNENNNTIKAFGKVNITNKNSDNVRLR